MTLLLTRSLLYSLVLHGLVFALLFVSFEMAPAPHLPVATEVDIVEAVTVDSSQVEQEIERIQEIEQQKQNEQLKKEQELARKLADLEKQTTAAEQQRKKEEQRLADLKQKQQAEEKRRKEEEQKLADAKKQQELLKKQQEEAERKKREEEAARKLAEQKKAEEEKKRQAEAAEKARQAEAEKKRLAAQEQADMNVIAAYQTRIQSAIMSQFNTVGLDDGLSCVIEIRMIPGGDVADVKIVRSSGNTIFDSRAEIAVKRASPLPVPDDARIFAKMRAIRLTFDP